MLPFHAFQAGRSKINKSKAGKKRHLIEPKVKVVKGRIVKAAPVIKKAVAAGQAKAKNRGPKASSVEEEYDDEFSGFSNTEDIVEPYEEDSSESSSDESEDDPSEEDSPASSDEQTEDDLLSLVPEENPFFIANKEKLTVLIRPVETLALSGKDEANFLDTTIESGHEDDVLRGIFASLLFRYHCIDQNTMRQYIIPKRIPIKSALYQLVRERCKHWNTKYKSGLMKSYLDSITITIEVIDNAEQLSRVAKSERRAFWGVIHRKSPGWMASNRCVLLENRVGVCGA